VSDPVAVARATARAMESSGAIDILVNAAGVQGPIGPLWENDFSGWLEIVRTHLLGTFLFCRAVLPSMIARRRGKIVNFSGGGAATPRPRFTAYASTKAAVVRLTETLAEEVKAHNIQVNAIAPGAVYTRLTEAVITAGDAAGPEGLAEALHTRDTGGTPPERAAELVAFLASPESGGLTGRLISALWDDWPAMVKQFPELAAVGGYALRRLDPHVVALAFQAEPLRAKLPPAARKEPE
jgi:NAD(P)-dependent dehydrogenase (short-subunit alcohol dehydrogenase family)